MTSSSPKVSVLMAVKNEEEHIAESLKSILNQTFAAFELLICNDGSEDATTQIIENFKAPGIKVISHKHSMGLAASLNELAKMAKGEYLARMDGDDISHPKRLARQVRFLDENPGVEVVGSWHQVIDDIGKTIAKYNGAYDAEDIANRLTSANPLVHGSVMMRRSVFEYVGGYDERFVEAEDYDLWLRMSRKTNIAKVPDYLYSWRADLIRQSIEKRALQARYVRAAQQRVSDPMLTQFDFSTPSDNDWQTARVSLAKDLIRANDYGEARMHLKATLLDSPLDFQAMRWMVISYLSQLKRRILSGFGQNQ